MLVGIVDASGNSCQKDVAITIDPSTPPSSCMTPTTLPNAQYGDPSYYGILTPVVPIVSMDAVWTVVSGSLPPGLTLDGSANYTGGIVAIDPYSGGASACGTYNFTVNVTASSPPTNCNQAISLTVVAPIGFSCGSTPTTPPAGGGWAWPDGNSGGIYQIFYSAGVCNGTCVNENLQIHFTASAPWHSSTGGQMILGIIVNGNLVGTETIYSPPTNVQDVTTIAVLTPFSVNTIALAWYTQSGNIDANSGGLSFAFI